MIAAKTIVDNKFWVLEENGMNVGTLQKIDIGYTTNFNGAKTVLKDKKSVRTFFGINVFPKPTKLKKLNIVYGFETSAKPFNEMWDLKRKLPLFTKAANSRSLFCAGYYIIKFEKGWAESFCPKSITLNKYEYIGPLKTLEECRAKKAKL